MRLDVKGNLDLKEYGKITYNGHWYLIKYPFNQDFQPISERAVKDTIQNYILKR